MVSLSSLIAKTRSMLSQNSSILRDCTSGHLLAKNDDTVKIGEKPLSKIRLSGVSKMGNLSWTGCLAQQPVKIYQTFSPAHAQYIDQVSREPGLREHFPKVLYIHDSYLVVEWAQGLSLHTRIMRKDPQLLLSIAKMQAKFQNSMK